MSDDRTAVSRPATATGVTSEAPTALIAGCGDLGTEVGLRLTARGDRVLGLRRTVDVLPPQIPGLSVDLTHDVPDLPPGRYERVAIILTADSRDEEAYRATYVGGLKRVFEALGAAGIEPERAVLVSSTGVYGDLTGDLDETTAPRPARPTHDVLLEAERLFLERMPRGTVLRLSGLYGPGRGRFIERARRGEIADSWTNRIHRDDAAAAVVHLLTMSDHPGPLYLGTDTEPAHALDVADHIRGELGLPPQEPSPRVADDEGRRLSSTALRASGFEFAYPSYREGYSAIIAGEGRRHP
ncbi:NAD-dependent epimerase/dehydratase family protein [Mobilicoccus massiliensis]|uniref:NAD-dependent epimerase/dehydratase family protein n=1 Tax=Mobilicoccus massiliensis TaxID=1522310 RepID=UPI000AB5E305|nr:NAD-dependent epimerase/dehydratase family protein [Mobilicoccus massiliensis]